MPSTVSTPFTRSNLQAALCCGLLVAGLGCKDLTGSPGLPAGTPNPSFYNTPAGALGLRNAAMANVAVALPQYILDAGRLTDELQDWETGASTGTLLQNNGDVTDPLDERLLPEGLQESNSASESYRDLQNIRGAANLALHALALYDTAATMHDSANVLRGELYAMEGYAEIMLADLFCSGVPLSTLDFQGDFTYLPGSTTTQVYQDALAKLDSAQLVGSASDSLVNLIRVLRGRTYLDLGAYDSAAAAVANVPTAFQYTITYTEVGVSGNWLNSFATVSDTEGGNGLPYRSSGDPRTTTTVTCIPPRLGQPACPSDTLTFPTKYSSALVSPGYTTFVIANGIEAQLIDAEAQLQPATQANNGPWLTTLNHLRESIQLPDTTDPGTPEGRISLLFRERAFWLFLTGHRQGDLRRLLRQYTQYPAFQSQQKVYPTGTYTAPGTGRYGTDVTAPIPTTEDPNPYFHGCKDRNP